MFFSSLRRITKGALPASRQVRRAPRGSNLRCEELEPRLQLSKFFFSTGIPDGRIATISEPPDAHNSHVEFETADDFVLSKETAIQNATFTGLLTGGATLKDVKNVLITIYRVFPFDSDLTRTPQVPTRVNSPADNEIINRDSAAGELGFGERLLSTSFSVLHSVSSADKIHVKSGGNGAVTGEEVQFGVSFRVPLDLPAGHYFFVPKVGLRDDAPAGSDFLWLSAPKPIQPPGTPFTPDLQSWMRDEPGLAPDWLRVGADIIGGTAFNGSFALFGQTGPNTKTEIGADSAAPDSRVADLSPALIDSLLEAQNFASNAAPLASLPADGIQHEPLNAQTLVAANTAVATADAQHVIPPQAQQQDAAFMDWSDGFIPALA